MLTVIVRLLLLLRLIRAHSEHIGLGTTDLSSGNPRNVLCDD